MTEMTSRERVLTACRRHEPDRVPRIIPMERQVLSELIGRFGACNADELQRIFKVDLFGVGMNPTRLQSDYSRYFTREGVTWGEWGNGQIWDQDQHYAEYVYPLEQAETITEYAQYPWPDTTAPYRYAGMAERVQILHIQGYAVYAGVGDCFELAWQLRSMDRLFEDLLTEDEKAYYLLDKIQETRLMMAREAARADVDILVCGDDVAMQTGLMMSPELLNKWFIPRLAAVITAAREIKPDLHVWYHSDGKIDNLIPDLIHAGVDILNPVQPECVDHRWVKATFGDRLSFSGGLGVQSILPFGTPEQVHEHTRETIEILGQGGGLIIAPSHVIERDMPLVNITTMLDAIDAYGTYPLGG